MGYGDFDSSTQGPGLVCCWSLKNPTVWVFFNLHLPSQTSTVARYLLSSLRHAELGCSSCGSAAVHSRCCRVSSLQWPERVIHCDSAVTCLDFSFNSPSQLAVGMRDGSIAIYNVQSQSTKSYVISSRWGLAVLKSHTEHDCCWSFLIVSLTLCSECPNKHLGPVWQLKWIRQELNFTGEEKVEALFSVAADGRISKWFVCNNGLDCIGTVLMFSKNVLTLRRKKLNWEELWGNKIPDTKPFRLLNCRTWKMFERTGKQQYIN